MTTPLNPLSPSPDPTPDPAPTAGAPEPPEELFGLIRDGRWLRTGPAPDLLELAVFASEWQAEQEQDLLHENGQEGWKLAIIGVHPRHLAESRAWQARAEWAESKAWEASAKVAKLDHEMGMIEVRAEQAESDLSKTADDILAVIEGRDPETWAWPLWGLRDRLVAEQEGRERAEAEVERLTGIVRIAVELADQVGINWHAEVVDSSWAERTNELVDVFRLAAGLPVAGDESEGQPQMTPQEGH